MFYCFTFGVVFPILHGQFMLTVFFGRIKAKVYADKTRYIKPYEIYRTHTLSVYLLCA